MDVIASPFTSSLDRATPHPVESAAVHVKYRPDVDGLRAVAALSVIAQHASALPGGFVGVDIFFVISGYLISGIILRSLTKGTFSFAEFYSRRVRRIFPTLTLVLFAVLLGGWLLLLADELSRLGLDVLEAATFTTNFTNWLDRDPHTGLPRVLVHLWSLGVEEQFYLFWPLLLCGIWRWARKYLAQVILMITAVSFLLDVAVSLRWPWTAFALPWTRIWQLSLGCTLAWIEMNNPHGSASRAPSGFRLWGPNLKSLLGAALLIGALTLTDGAQVATLPALWKVAPTVGAVLLISAGESGWINQRVLSSAPMVFFGLISYPMYLWHLPLFRFLDVTGHPVVSTTAVVGVAVTILLSVVTCRYVETPLRTSRHTKLTTTALLIALVSCGCLGGLAFLGVLPARAQSSEVDRLVSVTTEDWLTGEHNTFWSSAPSQFIALGQAPVHALYIGDRSMQQYYPRIRQLLRDHPDNTRGATFAVLEGCVPGELGMRHVDAPAHENCRKFLDSAFAYAAAPSVDTVVVGFTWWQYFQTASGQSPARDEPALESLARILSTLVAKGKRVYVVLDAPHDAALDPRRMVKRTPMSGDFSVTLRSPERASVTDANLSVASKMASLTNSVGAHLIDPVKSLCDSIRCPVSSSDGDLVYRDGRTLRPSYVREHVDFLDETLF